MIEIVGVLKDDVAGTITNDPHECLNLIRTGRVKQLLSKQHMQFMAACDLGIRWETLAKSPTLFKVDDKGNVYSGDVFKIKLAGEE